MKVHIILILFFAFTGLLKGQEQWINYSTATTVNDIAFEGDTVWICTDGGIVMINQKSGKTEFYDMSNTDLLANKIMSVAIDSFNNKWFGTSNDLGLQKSKKEYVGSFIEFDNLNWTNYTFPDSGFYSFSSLIVDDSNHVWMEGSTGHEGGLYKFDGESLILYDSETSGISYKNIYTIQKDSLEDLWLGTRRGLVNFDGINWTLFDTSNSILPYERVTCLAIDDDNTLWIGSESDNRLIKYDGSNWFEYLCPCEMIFSIVLDDSNNKWIGTDNGLLKFDGMNWVVYDSTYDQILNNEVYLVEVDEYDNKWLFVDNAGLIKFGKGGLTNYNISKTGIPSNYIDVIAIDNSNNSWLGIKYGPLVKYDGTSWTTFDLFEDDSDIWWYRITDIAVDSENNIWIGSENKGLAFYDHQSFRYYDTSNSNIIEGDIWDIEIDHEDILWIVTPYGLCSFDGDVWETFTDNDSITFSNIMSVTVDKYGNKWMGGEGFIVKYNGRSWIVYNFPYSQDISTAVFDEIAVIDTNNIWFSLRNFPILGKFDGINWMFFDTLSLEPIIINDILIDGDDNVWIGVWYPFPYTIIRGGFKNYNPFGLLYYKDDNWNYFSTDNSGLPTNDVTSLAIDQNSNIWIGTNGGGLSIYNENGVVTGLADETSTNTRPKTFLLSQNYPNPFNPSTTIKYHLPGISQVTLMVYNTVGQRIWFREIRHQSAGDYEVKIDLSGHASGVYFYRLEAGSFSQKRKMILLK